MDLQAQADRPAVQRLERQDFQQQQVEGALDEVVWFAHLGFLGEHTGLPLGKQGERTRPPTREPPHQEKWRSRRRLGSCAAKEVRVAGCSFQFPVSSSDLRALATGDCVCGYWRLAT